MNYDLPHLPSMYSTQSNHFMEAVRDVNRTMQAKVESDEIVAVSYSNGSEQISIGSVLVYQETAMAVLTGNDASGNPTNVIGHVNSIQLTWKVVKRIDDNSREQIGFTDISLK